MSSVVLISTAEFVLKSHPVRKLLTRLLKRHLRFNMKRMGLENFRIKQAGGLLVVGIFDNAETVAKHLARTLGVAHTDACERANADLSEIVECAARLAEKKIEQGETFAVRARNFEPSHLKGKEIEIRAGAEILSRLSHAVKVDLDNPNHTVRVFFGANDAFVSGMRFDGPGGLPVGSQGNLLGLATDPAYSPLSFFLLMKRGAMVWPAVPGLPQLLGETRPETILEGLRRLTPFVPKKTYFAFLMEPDEEALRVLDAIDMRFRRTFSIRLVFRAIARLAQTRRALGLVTGDSFGQAGLEALRDLRVTDEVAKIPVYRPLLTLDSDTISRQLRELELMKQVKEAGGAPGPISLSYASWVDLKKLEEHFQVENLAQKIAANSTKIPI